MKHFFYVVGVVVAVTVVILCRENHNDYNHRKNVDEILSKIMMLS